ncbi:MAG: ABC transporter permease [Thermocaproicibacter melissae]|jgi:putative tryptophan/tyrosine transport system permease protein|uniref:ABC transporter permease n=1 Tax=Thermocaproicibacter melissae TaxID=2966552 RepID=UPI003A0FD5FF
MDIFLGLANDVLMEGFIYAIMAIGVYVTYSVLNFPDLSVDGTFPLGACVTGALILAGVNPWVACVIAFLCGAVAGGITGLLHVRLHITDLLSGILVMTALGSVNLIVTGGKSMLAYYNMGTIFKTGLMAKVPKSAQNWVYAGLALLCCVAVKILVDLFLKTKTGLLLRAAGDNPQYVVSLGKDPGNMKILGLMIGNGCTALAGSILSQRSGSANIWSGSGMVVMALAAVIIGTSIFGRLKFMSITLAVILGTVVYKLCLVLAMQLGLPADDLNLLMAVLLTVALVLNNLAPTGGRRKKPDVNPTQI